MTNKITDTQFNETLDQVTNYLSWETDAYRIETVLRFWGHFQVEMKKPALGANPKAAHVALTQFIKQYSD
jgi:nucleoid DNA-binding protein